MNSNGLIGLGPNAGSEIEAALGGTAVGYGPLDNIFLQDESAQNIITILLGRVDGALLHGLSDSPLLSAY